MIVLSQLNGPAQKRHIAGESAVVFSFSRNISLKPDHQIRFSLGPLTCTNNAVHAFFRPLLIGFLHLGTLGLLLLGILDSSFFFLPFGNDLLLVVLIARYKQHLPVYVLSAALGSMLGVLFLDLVCRRGGRQGLEKMMTRKQFDYVEKKMARSAGFAIAIACLAPPPFPFTILIAAASAFQYPRSRLLGIVLAGRMVRFTLVGLLALRFGRHILRITRSEEFFWFMNGFILFCAIGSAIQIARWIQRSRLVPVS